MVPLFPGIPGGPELLLVLLVLLVLPLIVVGAAVALGVKILGDRSGGANDDERIRELEREVDDLHERLGEDDGGNR